MEPIKIEKNSEFYGYIVKLYALHGPSQYCIGTKKRIYTFPITKK